MIKPHVVIYWYYNSAVGVQFVPNQLRKLFEQENSKTLYPLFATPAHPYQEPAAWYSKSGLVTISRDAYRPEIEWLPLYAARD